mmetsp:Transcript_13197/g.13248  ORF Transcript_13197/g.13248 Transcript_13197/m.13248 type:complete len:241 (+) Transcript_13197:216-938(+)
MSCLSGMWRERERAGWKKEKEKKKEKKSKKEKKREAEAMNGEEVSLSPSLSLSPSQPSQQDNHMSTEPMASESSSLIKKEKSSEKKRKAEDVVEKEKEKEKESVVEGKVKIVPFVESKKFTGAKSGYKFQKGVLGVGYYIDAVQIKAKNTQMKKKKKVLSGDNQRLSVGSQDSKHVHFGKPKSIDYISSVNALRVATPSLSSTPVKSSLKVRSSIGGSEYKTLSNRKEGKLGKKKRGSLL